MNVRADGDESFPRDDLLSLDRWILPINVDNTHWIVAVVNFQLRTIQYFDSLYDLKHLQDEQKNDRRVGRLFNIRMIPTIDLTLVLQ